MVIRIPPKVSMGVPDAFPNIVKIVKNFTRVRDSRLLPNVPIFGRKLLLGKRRENAEHQSMTMRFGIICLRVAEIKMKQIALTK